MQSLQDMQVKLIFVFCLSKCSTLLPRGWHLLPRCPTFCQGVHTFYQGAHTFCQGVHTFCQGVHKPFVKVSTHLLPRCPHLLPRCSYLLSRCSHEGAHTFCQGVQPFDKVSTPKGHSHPLADCQSQACTKYTCMSFVQTLVALFPKLTLWPVTDICPTKGSAL